VKLDGLAVKYSTDDPSVFSAHESSSGATESLLLPFTAEVYVAQTLANRMLRVEVHASPLLVHFAVPVNEYISGLVWWHDYGRFRPHAYDSRQEEVRCTSNPVVPPKSSKRAQGWWRFAIVAVLKTQKASVQTPRRFVRETRNTYIDHYIRYVRMKYQNKHMASGEFADDGEDEDPIYDPTKTDWMQNYTFNGMAFLAVPFTPEQLHLFRAIAVARMTFRGFRHIETPSVASAFRKQDISGTKEQATDASLVTTMDFAIELDEMQLLVSRARVLGAQDRVLGPEHLAVIVRTLRVACTNKMSDVTVSACQVGVTNHGRQEVFLEKLHFPFPVAVYEDYHPLRDTLRLDAYPASSSSPCPEGEQDREEGTTDALRIGFKNGAANVVAGSLRVSADDEWFHMFNFVAAPIGLALRVLSYLPNCTASTQCVPTASLKAPPPPRLSSDSDKVLMKIRLNKLELPLIFNLQHFQTIRSQAVDLMLVEGAHCQELKGTVVQLAWEDVSPQAKDYSQVLKWRADKLTKKFNDTITLCVYLGCSGTGSSCSRQLGALRSQSLSFEGFKALNGADQCAIPR
jgi:hypothetical protein